MLIPAIVLILFVIVTSLQLRNPRPLSLFNYRFRLISGVLLLILVWGLDNPGGKILYKYLLTVMALVSMYAAHVQFKKRRPNKS